MFRKSSIAACVCAAAACGGGSTPQGVTLKGQLMSSAAARQSDPLLLAMGWYPTFAGTAPGSPVGAVITQANITYAGNFPVDFTFTLTGAPPAAALFDLSQTGGTGHLAYGVLIAFRDVNKNGVFDANSAGKAEADVIAGISVPDPSRPPPEHGFFVLYLDGKVAANDIWGAFPELHQGYNLMQIHYDFGINPVPLTTSLTIPITNSPALNLYACQAAFQDTNWFKRACGIDPYGGTWQAQGSVFSTQSATQAQLFVNDADGNVANASISLDGTAFTYEDVSQDYAFTGPQLQGTHSMSISVPNRASETLSLTFPAPVTVVSPAPNQSFPSGSSVPIAWAPSAGTAYYDIYFLANDGSGDWLYHTITSDTSAMTPPISYVGSAHATVKALAPLAVGSQGSFVTPISQTTVNVTFTR
jgi:hypothetical protein